MTPAETIQETGHLLLAAIALMVGAGIVEAGIAANRDRFEIGSDPFHKSNLASGSNSPGLRVAATLERGGVLGARCQLLVWLPVFTLRGRPRVFSGLHRLPAAGWAFSPGRVHRG